MSSGRRQSQIISPQWPTYRPNVYESRSKETLTTIPLTPASHNSRDPNKLGMIEEHKDEPGGQYKPPASRWSSSASSVSDQFNNRSNSRSSLATTTSSGSSSASKFTIASLPTDPLPENGSVAPTLWNVENNSKYSPLYRQIVSKIGFFLWDLDLDSPQYGLFRAGDNPEGFLRNPEVLAFLMAKKDMHKWTDVDPNLVRLCSTYWGKMEPPPIRYWIRADGPLKVERKSELELKLEKAKDRALVETAVVDFATVGSVRRPIIVRIEERASAESPPAEPKGEMVLGEDSNSVS